MLKQLSAGLLLLLDGSQQAVEEQNLKSFMFFSTTGWFVPNVCVILPFPNIYTCDEKWPELLAEDVIKISLLSYPNEICPHPFYHCHTQP